MPGDPIPSPEREWRCRNDGTLLGVRRGDTVDQLTHTCVRSQCAPS